MFCTKCGYKNNEETRFCVKCGNAMTGAGITPTVYTAYARGPIASSNKFKRNLGWIVGAVLLIILIVVILLVSISAKSGVNSVYDLSRVS